jgi:hypothetical protein
MRRACGVYEAKYRSGFPAPVSNECCIIGYKEGKVKGVLGVEGKRENETG